MSENGLVGFEREYVGTVEDNTDPEQLGRLRVRIPELYGQIPVAHLPWAIPKVPFGGPGYGIFMIPVPGSQVFVELWRSHPWFPVWTGNHWFKGSAPAESQVDAAPTNYVIKTPKGHLIDFHDENGYIRIRDNKGNYIIINAEDGTININVENHVLTEAGSDVDITAGKSYHIKTGRNLDEKVGQGRRTRVTGTSSETVGISKRIATVINFDVQAGVGVNIRTGGSINLTAGGAINLLAGLGVNIDGTSVNIMNGVAQAAKPQRPEQPE